MSIASAYSEDRTTTWHAHLHVGTGEPVEQYKGEFSSYIEAARECGGPVLELACGAGRVLVPMAEAGIEVYGLEASWPMLKKAQLLLARRSDEVQSRVHLIQGDMRRFAFARRFPLIIIPYCSFWWNFRNDWHDGEARTFTQRYVPDFYSLGPEDQEKFRKNREAACVAHVHQQAEHCLTSIMTALPHGGRFMINAPEWSEYGKKNYWDEKSAELNFSYAIIGPQDYGYKHDMERTLVGTKL